MLDDRDFSWLGPKQAAPAATVEHVLYTVTKDVRTASVLVRAASSRPGSDLPLTATTCSGLKVFRPGDGRDLGKVAADTLKSFEASGWVRVEEPATTAQPSA